MVDSFNRLDTIIVLIHILSRGFNNWKDGTVGFTKRESSECHKEAVQVMEVIPHET